MILTRSFFCFINLSKYILRFRHALEAVTLSLHSGEGLSLSIAAPCWQEMVFTKLPFFDYRFGNMTHYFYALVLTYLKGKVPAYILITMYFITLIVIILTEVNLHLLKYIIPH